MTEKPTMFTQTTRATHDADQFIQAGHRVDLRDVARARSGSTPEALTIIDPYASPTRLRRLADGFEVL